MVDRNLEMIQVLEKQREEKRIRQEAARKMEMVCHLNICHCLLIPLCFVPLSIRRQLGVFKPLTSLSAGCKMQLPATKRQHAHVLKDVPIHHQEQAHNYIRKGKEDEDKQIEIRKRELERRIQLKLELEQQMQENAQRRKVRIGCVPKECINPSASCCC